MKHLFITKAAIRYVFSLYVVTARNEKGLTQQELAEQVQASVRWIQLIEKGRRLPGFCLAINLIVALEIDPLSLFQAILAQQQKKEEKRVPVSTH